MNNSYTSCRRQITSLWLIIPFFIFGTIIIISCSKTTKQELIIALVNNEPIFEKELVLFEKVNKICFKGIDYESLSKSDIINQLIERKIVLQEAKKLKIGVSDFEVAMEVLNTQSFYDNGRFNVAQYVRTIWSKYRMTPKEYEEWRRKERMVMNLKNFIYNTIKVTDDDLNLYSSIIDKKNLPKEKKDFAEKLKEQKFLDCANYYLRQLTTRIEIKDYRKNFETTNQANG